MTERELPIKRERVKKMQKPTLLISILLMTFALSACTVSTAGVGVRRGAGFAMVTIHNEFLYSGPGAAYQNNRQGLRLFKGGEYLKAANTFQRTLNDHPANPDAVYFLGLSLIGMEQRDQGFDTLDSFRDPWRYRITGEIRWWANYLRKRTHLTPREIFNTMKRIRAEAYNQYIREEYEGLPGFIH